MFIKITPFDTLFFRTGRPFSGGEDTWVDTVFPPFPSTLYGAIRSLLIFHMGTIEDFKAGRFKEIIGTPTEKGSMKLKGPFLHKKGDIFLRSPHDILRVNDKGKLEPLKLLKKPNLFISNYGLEDILVWPKEDTVDESTGFIDMIEFIDYLKNKKETYYETKKEEIYVWEYKIGIARNKATGTSKEGYLYRIPLIRLLGDANLVVKVEGVNDFPTEGAIQLGGESKAAKFEKTDAHQLEELVNIDLNFSEGFFKVYLATPAVFENGWLPKWIDEETLEGKFEGVKLKLIACAIGRSIPIGGWDMAKNRPKPMRRAVPAGSVYYFQLVDNNSATRVKEAFHLKNISDLLPEEGFGLAILGEVKL